jgi:hypothetical protein
MDEFHNPFYLLLLLSFTLMTGKILYLDGGMLVVKK